SGQRALPPCGRRWASTGSSPTIPRMPRQPLTIPARLVADYRSGRLRTIEIARRLGVSEDVARNALRRQGATLSMSEAKRAAFARRVERANGLRSGTLYAHVARLYRRGLSEKEIARKLGMAGRMSALILERAGVEPRPVWCRSALFVDGV